MTTPDQPTRLATYGTLSPGRENHYLLVNLRGRWSTGSVHGHLHPRSWGAALGFPGLVLDPAGPAVPVHLFDSPDLPRIWPELDAFEGPGYRRTLTTIHTPKGDLQAFLYALAPLPDPILDPVHPSALP